MKTLIKHQKK